MDFARPLPASGILFIGKRGVLMSGFTGGPLLIPESKMDGFRPPPKTLPRTTGHYQEFVQAAKGGKPANCNFEFGSLLTEITLLGAIAVRTRRPLVWDASARRFTYDAEANWYVEKPNRQGWSI